MLLLEDSTRFDMTTARQPRGMDGEGETDRDSPFHGLGVLGRTRTMWGLLGGRRFVPPHSESTTAIRAGVCGTDRDFTVIND